MSAGTSVGVILAAGRGSRMLPFSEDFPKCLLPVCNRPLIYRQILTLREAGVRTIFVVVGHLGAKVREAVGSGRALGVEVHYVVQQKPMGIAHALSLVEGLAEAPFLLLLGDIYFETEGLSALLRQDGPAENAAVLAVRRDTPEAIRKNFEVCLGEDGLVERVVEKPETVEGSLKGCGIYYLGGAIFEAIRKTKPSDLRGELELTDAIQVLLDQGCPVVAREVIQKDINLSYPGDLLRANLAVLRSDGGANLVSDSAAVDRRVRIRNSIVGPDAVLEGTVRLRDSLVLAGARLNGGRDLKNVIVTAGGILPCPLEQRQGSLVSGRLRLKGGVHLDSSSVGLRISGDER